ncbi:MAG: phosphatidylserine decarboxylase [Elusimicrobiota bacterium]|nr:phosphatidylserine decarboxylase [Elusimicrobiota bacterium]
MKIAPQAWPFVVGGTAVGSAGLFLMGRPDTYPWGVPLLALGGVFTAFCLYFYRDPERTPPADPAKIYSPGDGRVLSVAREGPDDAWVIRIFLSVFDVHIQRAPCAGKVVKVEEIPGSFAAAMADAAKGNYRVAMTLETANGPLVVEQISGLIARRIECWRKPGDAVTSGERYGIIYFGSQASVRLPAGAEAACKPGDRVVGGMSEIARWTNKR